MTGDIAHVDLSGTVPAGTSKGDPSVVSVSLPAPSLLIAARVVWPGPDVGVRLRKASGTPMYPTFGRRFAEAPVAVSEHVGLETTVEDREEIVAEFTNDTGSEQFVRVSVVAVTSPMAGVVDRVAQL